jgi:arylsulfatase A-like enzyme
MAAVGVPDVKERLLEGYQAGDKHFRVHLDGYNRLPYLTGEAEESPRHEFYYYGERELYAIRYNNWKVHRPASTPEPCSKRCSRPPPSAKETSNGGRQGMMDDMLAGSRR